MLVTVDTGGTKTLIASFGHDGSLGGTIRFPTPVNQKHYISLLKETLRHNYADQPVEAVVVAIPGIVRNGVAVRCGNLGWRNFDIKSALAGVLGDAEVLVENDANLAGLGETRILDPMPSSSLYVTVSTGIGTGLIVDGRIDPGMRHSEGGHALIEYNGTIQQWEDFASGRAINTVYKKFARDITSKKTWDEIADRISRGFLAVIPIIQPEVIIFGGSVGTYFDRYEAELTRLLDEKLPDIITRPRLIQATHPEEAVIYGCYYYALDHLANN